MNDTTRPPGRMAPHPDADAQGEDDPYAALDPGRAMRRALQSPSGPAPGEHRPGGAATTAEDTVLSWLLGLPAGVDPALAARQLVADVDGVVGRSRLGRLMIEIGRWPAERLDRLSRGRRAPG